MKAEAFDIYTEQLRAALESNSEVVGLVTLGTTADFTFRDEWSDHDFWVITKAGAQDSLVHDLSWLPEAAGIAITVCHGPRRRTVMYRNRHKAEFAVFDVNEACEGKIQRYRILIDRDQIAELIESIHRTTLSEAQTVKARPDALQNLCILIWCACERYSRGELLSARQYLDGFAVNQLLNLLSAFEPSDDGRDELDPRRRLELRSPELAAELLTILKAPVPAGALHLLDIAERELKPKVPTLTWENVKMIRDWITELLRSTTQRP